jgi:predicted nucleic acid-binding protein
VIIVDANVIIHFICETDQSGYAREVYKLDPDWIVPHHCEAEVLNSLVKMVRADMISTDEAVNAWYNAEILLKDAAQPCNGTDVLMVSTDNRITAYDAYYLILARSSGFKLITEDRELLKKFPSIAVSMADFVNPPGPGQTVREKTTEYSVRSKRAGKRA